LRITQRWLHVDAAWAGLALCCPENREALHLPAINAAADSFTTNFHKVRTAPDLAP
jgi:aromatic-L-amino-acid decarboxylase